MPLRDRKSEENLKYFNDRATKICSYVNNKNVL